MIKLRIFQAAQFACCVLIFALVQTPCFAQSNNDTPSQQSAGADQQIPPAIAKELEAMRKRIDELEAELKSSKAPERPATPVTSAKATVPLAPIAPVNTVVPTESSSSVAPTTAAAPPAHAPAEAKVAKIEPFSNADWTWLNGNPRTKEIFWDSKFFTPEIRADAV